MKTCVEDIEQICLECGRICCNRRSLGNHLARSHKSLGGLKEYVLKHFTNGEIPKCKCGCGNNIKWNTNLYKFNDYISGHNPAGFKVKQPNFTKEQRAKMAESQRKLYEDPERRKRMSETVKKSYQDPKKKENLVNALNKSWDNDERRKKHSETQKKVWEENYEERCKKVFTEEFGRKISKANMDRNIKRVSKKELIAISILKNIFPDIKNDKWLNFREKRWCSDAWLPKENLLIEFDGLYWHGLNKNSNFNVSQINNMINDIHKNKLAIQYKLSLIRIKENTDLSNIKSYDDLINIAYHVVTNGKVLKECSPIYQLETLIAKSELNRYSNDYITNIILNYETLINEYRTLTKQEDDTTNQLIPIEVTSIKPMSLPSSLIFYDENLSQLPLDNLTKIPLPIK